MGIELLANYFLFLDFICLLSNLGWEIAVTEVISKVVFKINFLSFHFYMFSPYRICYFPEKQTNKNKPVALLPIWQLKPSRLKWLTAQAISNDNAIVDTGFLIPVPRAL